MGSHLSVVGADGIVVDLGLVARNSYVPYECENTPRWSPDGVWLIGVRAGTDVFAWRPGLSTPVGFRLTDLVVGFVDPIEDLDVGAPDRLRTLIVVRG